MNRRKFIFLEFIHILTIYFLITPLFVFYDYCNYWGAIIFSFLTLRSEWYNKKSDVLKNISQKQQKQVKNNYWKFSSDIFKIFVD